MYERDLFRVRDLLGFGWGQARFRLGGEHARGMDLSQTSTLDFVTGRSQRELIGWGREIAEERIFPRVYEDIVRVIATHRERGDLTFLVTAAPIELAQTIAEELDMTGAIGTTAELDERGCYTGRLEGPIMHGTEKAKAVEDVAAQHGVDLAECHAYSDSVNDLPLLEAVGHPHAVNPERELRRMAFARGWPIHELRTRRRALLVGIPAGIGGVALFGSGVGLGLYLERRRQALGFGPIERLARRLGI
jgi:HAD superfamily hydrolase (TIGR01490 family)